VVDRHYVPLQLAGGAVGAVPRAPRPRQVVRGHPPIKRRLTATTNSACQQAQVWPPRDRFVSTEEEDNGAAAGPRRSARLAQRQQAAPAETDGRRRSRRLAVRAGGDGAGGAESESDASNTSHVDMGIDWESDEESYDEGEDAEFDDDEEVEYVDDDDDEQDDEDESDDGGSAYAAVPTSDAGPLSDDARRMAEELYSGVMLDKVRAAMLLQIDVPQALRVPCLRCRGCTFGGLGSAAISKAIALQAAASGSTEDDALRRMWKRHA